TPGTISVSDGSTAVTDSPFTGVTRIKLNLTSADDTVTLDLGGQTFSGNVGINLGTGANSLTVSNGGISGNLAVTGNAASGGCKASSAFQGGFGGRAAFLPPPFLAAGPGFPDPGHRGCGQEGSSPSTDTSSTTSTDTGSTSTSTSSSTDTVTLAADV